MTPTDGAETRPARRFRVPVATAVLAIIIIAPLVITGAVNLHQFRNAYRTKVSNELSVMIERHSLTVDSFINDRLSDIRVIAREHPIDRLRRAEFLRRVLNLMREEYHGAFVDLGLVNAERHPGGVRRTVQSPDGRLLGRRLVPGCGGQRELSSAMSLPVCADRPTSSSRPRRTIGRRTFVVKATIDFEAFNALVENLRIGSTGFAFIINREGEFQTNPHFEVALNRPPYVGSPGWPDPVRPDLGVGG